LCLFSGWSPRGGSPRARTAGAVLKIPAGIIMIEIPEMKDVMVGELAQHGDWVVGSIETSIPWLTKAQKIQYRRNTVWVLPVMKDHYPSVAIKRPGTMSREESERFLMRLISAVSWVEGEGAIVEYLTAGNLPRPMGRDKQRGFILAE
jgi:hypothetical protein